MKSKSLWSNEKGVAHVMLGFFVLTVFLFVLGFGIYYRYGQSPSLDFFGTKGTVSSISPEGELEQFLEDNDIVFPENYLYLESNDLDSTSSDEENKNGHGIVYAAVYEGPRFWYIKDGNIWEAKKNATGKYAGFEILDFEQDILDFDVSSDNKLLAFVVKKFDYESLIYEVSSDTVFLKNLETKEVFELYTIDPDTESRINSVAFTPDNQKVVITNNKILVADIGDYNFQEFGATEKDSFCSNYSINDFSPNSDLLLVRMGCYEGSQQFVANLNDKEIIRQYNNGYSQGGTWILDFISNTEVFGYDTKDNMLGESKDFYTYNIFTDERKFVGEFDRAVSSWYNRVFNESGDIYFLNLFPEVVGVYDKSQGKMVEYEDKLFGVVRTSKGDLLYGDITELNPNNYEKIDFGLSKTNRWFPRNGNMDFDISY